MIDINALQETIGEAFDVEVVVTFRHRRERSIEHLRIEDFATFAKAKEAVFLGQPREVGPPTVQRLFVRLEMKR